VTIPDTKSREPKQARSRQSFEKTIEAALSLLQERGSDDFTLAEVSARSGVSIGSIYARFEGKDDLIRVAHGRKMDDIDAVSAHLFGELPVVEDTGLEERARVAVAAAVRILRRYAGILRPFMLRASQDEAISRRGAASHAALAQHFSELFSGWPGGSLRQEDIDWSFNVVYSVVARRLGLGSTIEGSGRGDWDETIDKLAGMVSSYLLARVDTPPLS
jgi:AcrR family transcriptional regulator